MNKIRTDLIIEKEGRFRALLLSSNDTVYTLTPDWKTMTALDGNGFISNVNEPTADWIDKFIPPSEKDKLREAIHKAIVQKSRFELEHMVFTAEGKLGWIFSRAIPVLNETGGIIEWFGSASNITKRKRAEIALLESKDQAEKQKRLYEAITRSTPDLIYVFDLEYRFTYANEALLTMWGKSWDEAIGKRLIENGYEDWHAEMHEREIDEVCLTKRPIRGEVAFPHAVLGRRTYDYIFTPVLNEAGEVEAVAGTTRDISEIKKNEERRKDFISMVSHELKTPLTSSMAYVQLLQSKKNGLNNENSQGFLNRIGSQLKKMAGLINGFLDVSRFHATGIQLKNERFLLKSLLEEVVEEMLSTSPKHGILIIPSMEVEINADRERVGNVLTNFISNAVKYAPMDSSIRISVERDDDNVWVSVQDEGPGVKEGDIERVFDRFFRSNDNPNTGVSGFGIGLYLSSEIIKAHGGSIGVENVPTGGSRFYFSLPLE